MFPFPFSFFGAAAEPPELELIDNNFAMEFSGDNYIDTSATPAQLSLPATTVSGGDFSISLWYKYETFTHGSPVIQSTTNYAWNDGFAIREETVFAQNKLRFWVGAQATYVRSGALNASQWYNISCVFKGGATHTLEIYVDGVLAQTADYTTSRDIHNSTSIYLGHDPTDGYTYYVNGDMDEVAIWSRALEATDIQRIYNATNNNPGKCANLWSGGLGTGLVYWNRMGD